VSDTSPSSRPSAASMDTDFARTPWACAIRAVWTGTVLRGLRAIFAPTTVVGRAHIDSVVGPVVIASNHVSHVDTMLISTTLPARLRRRMVVAAAADYFFASRVSAVYTAITVGAIPVERDRVNRRTLELCHRLLGEGWSLTLYPEGGRSPDGSMQPFKPGAAWIARRAGVPVVPVHLDGTGDVLPKGASFPRRAPVTVSYGAPLHLRDGEDAKEFGRRIEAAVHELAGDRVGGSSRRGGTVVGIDRPRPIDLTSQPSAAEL
jgi:1-acyl-sn-glycerol-3-phosphate acyltransferase